MATILLFAMLSPPIYQSTARIVVDPVGAGTFSLEMALQGTSEPDYIETQLNVLRSDTLALEVVRLLRLDRNPVVMKLSFIERIMRSLQAALPGNEGKHNRGTFNRELEDSRVGPAEMQAVEYLQKHVTERLVKNSRVIEITSRCSNMDLSSLIANKVAEQYVLDTELLRFVEVEAASERLARELEKVKKRAEGSKFGLARYRAKYKISSLDDKVSTVSETVRALIYQQAAAEADTIQLEASWSSMRKSNGGVGAKVVDDQIARQLIGKIQDISGQLTQASVYYSENHPTMVGLKGQLAELRLELDQREKYLVDELAASLKAAGMRERSLALEVEEEEKLLGPVSQYEALRREAQADEDLYHSLYSRAIEARMSASSKCKHIRIMDRAIVPIKPVWPDFFLIVPVGLVVACVGGVAAGVVRDRMDRSVRSVEDVRMVAGTTDFVVLPLSRSEGSRNTFWKVRSEGIRRSGKAWCDVDQFVFDRPSSVAAEGMRSLMGSILLNNKRRRGRVLLVSSPFAGEGKTTVAFNLASALSEKGSTCFIDGDLRKSKGDEVKGILGHYRDAATLEEIQVRCRDVANLTCV